MHTLARAPAAAGVNKSKVLRTDAVQRYAPPNALGLDAELSQRAELAEQVADLKAALENMKGERDRWRTLAERTSLPHQRAESNLTDAWWRTQSHTNPSPFPNSLLTGKLTGNFIESARSVRFLKPTREQFQRLSAKFPTQQNRELFRRNREFWRRKQGISPAKTEIIAGMRFSVHTSPLSDSGCGARKFLYGAFGCIIGTLTYPS